jgi:hypothetical protein
MQPTYLEKQVSRTNRNLFLIVLFFGALVVGLGALSRKAVVGLLEGSKPVNQKFLDGISDLNGLERDYVSLKGERNIDAGYQATLIGDFGSRSFDGEFHVLEIGGRYLIVRTPVKNDTRLAFTGLLQAFPDNPGAQIKADAERAVPGLKNKFYPFMLNASKKPDPYLAGMFAAGLLVFLWYLVQWVRRSGNPERHPMMRANAQHGTFTEINQEFEAENATAIQVGRVRMTDSWLLLKAFAGLSLTKVSEILWAYQKVTQHRTNGIPTGKSFAVMLKLRDGTERQLVMRKAQAEQMFENLAGQTPWIVFGYTHDLNKLWSQDRAAFEAAVSERRAAYASGGSQPASA